MPFPYIRFYTTPFCSSLLIPAHINSRQHVTANREMVQTTGLWVCFLGLITRQANSFTSLINVRRIPPNDSNRLMGQRVFFLGLLCTRCLLGGWVGLSISRGLLTIRCFSISFQDSSLEMIDLLRSIRVYRIGPPIVIVIS